MLREWLHLILDVGNFLNEGHNLGSAQGFTFESVLLLGEISSGDKTRDLISFIVESVYKSKPEMLEVSKELSGLVEVCCHALTTGWG